MARCNGAVARQWPLQLAASAACQGRRGRGSSGTSSNCRVDHLGFARRRSRCLRSWGHWRMLMLWRAYTGLTILYAFLLPDDAAACSLFPDQRCPSTAGSLSEKLAHIVVDKSFLSLKSREFTQTYLETSGSRSEDRMPPNLLRILCFGDSLTSGYLSTSLERYPYGDTLQTELAHMLSLPLSQVQVTVDGLPGSSHPS